MLNDNDSINNFSVVISWWVEDV